MENTPHRNIGMAPDLTGLVNGTFEFAKSAFVGAFAGLLVGAGYDVGGDSVSPRTALPSDSTSHDQSSLTRSELLQNASGQGARIAAPISNR